MCQLCDEADAYLAQLEAAAKKRTEEGGRPSTKPRPVRLAPVTPKGHEQFNLKNIAPCVRVY